MTLDQKQNLLQKYHLSAAQLLQKGMEAEVYALDSKTVLKLYNGTVSLAHLTTLQNFYSALDASAVSYRLPYIQKVAAEGDFCLSLERRLPGQPMSAVLPGLNHGQLEHLLRIYLSAVLELEKIPIPTTFDRYKLFDAKNLSQRTAGDWHHFLKRFLADKLIQLEPYFLRDVLNFTAKLEKLQNILSCPYTGPYRLIHGDFFPGNLLIDENHTVTALLDFGLLTMYGDPLFDIATGWVFFDMYDELKAGLRERLLALILETLGESVRGKLYRYVLLYSCLSANTYSPQCADGHYRWCIANLNTPAYWDALE